MCSFALVEPGVSAVPHQLTPFHPSLKQEALEGITAQQPELLQTQQICPERENLRQPCCLPEVLDNHPDNPYMNGSIKTVLIIKHHKF